MAQAHEHAPKAHEHERDESHKAEPPERERPTRYPALTNAEVERLAQIAVATWETGAEFVVADADGAYWTFRPVRDVRSGLIGFRTLADGLPVTESFIASSEELGRDDARVLLASRILAISAPANATHAQQAEAKRVKEAEQTPGTPEAEAKAAAEVEGGREDAVPDAAKKHASVREDQMIQADEARERELGAGSEADRQRVKDEREAAFKVETARAEATAKEAAERAKAEKADADRETATKVPHFEEPEDPEGMAAKPRQQTGVEATNAPLEPTENSVQAGALEADRARVPGESTTPDVEAHRKVIDEATEDQRGDEDAHKHKHDDKHGHKKDR